MLNKLTGLGLVLSLTLLPVPARSQVTIYGESGTFGSFGATVPSGESLTKVTPTGFNVSPGRGAFFTATTSDGTVFAAGFHQNGNNLKVTSCYMSITCLNPNAATCYDAASGLNKNSSEIHVLTRDGYPSIPRNEALCSPASTTFTIGAGGVDISDIQTVTTTSDEELVAYISTGASFGNSDINGFPMLGFLHKESGSWRLDSTRQFWRDDLAASSTAGQAACPSNDCGGVSELAFFKQSHTLVYGGYFPASQGVVVVDLDGVVQAHYAIPHPGNRCTTSDPSDTFNWVGVRQVDTDPTAPLGDERVVVTVDGDTPFNHPIQEFSYDDTNKTLAPVTNMVLTESGTEPLPDCTGQGQNSNYDVDGNLIVNATRGGKEVFHVYMKDSTTGRRSIEDNCAFTGYTEANFASACLADLSTGYAVGVGPNAGDTPTWDYAGINLTSSQQDPNTRILSRYDANAYVDLIDTFRSNDRTIYVSYKPVDLGVGSLPVTGHTSFNLGWKGVLDTNAKSLWVPVSPIVGPIVPGCTSLFCDNYANEDLPSWMYEVKYEQVLNANLRVVNSWIDQPTIDTSDEALIGFYVRATYTGTAKAAKSGFWIFPKDSATPVLVRQISRASCSGGQCNFQVKFHQDLLDGQPAGEYRWSLVLTTNDDATVHAQGVIEVE
jgi:hypothetical protein